MLFTMLLAYGFVHGLLLPRRFCGKWEKFPNQYSELYIDKLSEGGAYLIGEMQQNATKFVDTI